MKLSKEIREGLWGTGIIILFFLLYGFGAASTTQMYKGMGAGDGFEYFAGAVWPVALPAGVGIISANKIFGEEENDE